MTPRMDYFAAAPAAMKAMLALENQVRRSGLEHGLMELVKIRASQINGCAFCLHMHTRDARAAGETEERIYLLSAWRESPLFSPRERAALALTEALTLIAEGGVPDAVYDDARAEFAESELVELFLLVGVINVWNRFAIGFRAAHPVAAQAA